ncbi:MAG: hypothetical protein KDC92_15295 [Bacteroidetes bacterium]|nr:hypothetical protein [Bacteroidota bacterium]
MTIDNWPKVEAFIEKRFDKKPDLKAALFVIGMRELGSVQRKLTKEEKQDLMNLAFCKICSVDGYFRVDEMDADGWPIWKQVKPLPKMSAKEQEQFLKEHVVTYFETEELI